jgi:hypothetical protein
VNAGFDMGKGQRTVLRGRKAEIACLLREHGERHLLAASQQNTVRMQDFMSSNDHAGVPPFAGLTIINWWRS